MSIKIIFERHSEINGSFKELYTSKDNQYVLLMYKNKDENKDIQKNIDGLIGKYKWLPNRPIAYHKQEEDHTEIPIGIYVIYRSCMIDTIKYILMINDNN